MANVLIVYSTTDGHTLEICERIKEVVEQQHHDVILLSVTDSTEIDVDAFDKVVIGASIRYGKHHRQVYEFIKVNEQTLERKPNCPSSSKWDRCAVRLSECFAHHHCHIMRRAVDSANDVSRWSLV